MAITFQNQDIVFKLKEKQSLKDWITKTISKEKKKAGQINFLFMNDAAILENNVHYLDHDTYTDIITFDYCEDKIINGDIMISLERIEENAKKFKVPFETELHRVMIHGVLHLCGYKDKKKSDQDLMRKKENVALNSLRNKQIKK